MKNYNDILSRKLSALVEMMTTGQMVEYPRKAEDGGGYDCCFRPSTSEKAIAAFRAEVKQVWDEATAAGQNNWTCTFDEAIEQCINEGM